MNMTTRKICLAATFIALVVVISSFLQIPMGESIRVDLSYAVVMVASLGFGGLFGALIAFLARIINDMIFSGSISIWWAIGSAFWALCIGYFNQFIVKRFSNKVIRIVLLCVFVMSISFVSFVGIVPFLAYYIIGVDYMFMVSIGVIAAITDGLVALIVGYPLYIAVTKIPISQKFGIYTYKSCKKSDRTIKGDEQLQDNLMTYLDYEDNNDNE